MHIYRDGEWREPTPEDLEEINRGIEENRQRISRLKAAIEQHPELQEFLTNLSQLYCDGDFTAFKEELETLAIAVEVV